jgi:hypothetical protein
MENFVVESGKGKHVFFEDTLKRVNAPEHPNIQYFIYKSIILNNLYGVDIMKEAVEIAKLRLFLKLVAAVDADYHKPNLGLEPLPDVDFNIRAGNTLVGFATESDLDKNLVGNIDGFNAKAAIKEKCHMAARAFFHYKEIQLSYGNDFEDFKIAKDDLNHRLTELNNQLNQLLHKSDPQARKYDDWLCSHQPFHWLAEFYEIIADRGGFDVIIGNPPYVEYSDIRNFYIIKDYHTEECGNLFAFSIERAFNLLIENGTFGFIVPISSICTPRMKSLIKFEKQNSRSIYTSCFAVRPDKLFTGADMNLTIHITRKSKPTDCCAIYSTNYLRWYADYRNCLFPSINYGKGKLRNDGLIFKIQSATEIAILNTILNAKYSTGFLNSNRTVVYYHSGGRYFRKCVLEKLSNEYKPLSVPEKNIFHVIALFSSSIYFWYWVVFSDTYHVTKPDIDSFHFPQKLLEDSALQKLGNTLILDIETNKIIRERHRKDGSIQQEINYLVGKSKPIIDQIDALLAQHYGFTHEQLDFIINYDIKYRMGKELENEEN